MYRLVVGSATVLLFYRFSFECDNVRPIHVQGPLGVVGCDGAVAYHISLQDFLKNLFRRMFEFLVEGSGCVRSFDFALGVPRFLAGYSGKE